MPKSASIRNRSHRPRPNRALIDLIATYDSESKETIEEIKASIKSLIDEGANINGFTDENGKHISPLVNAIALSKSFSCMIALIELGADVNINGVVYKKLNGRIYFNNHTPLTILAGFDSTEAAERLINLGANINLKNDDGYAPLIIALNNDNTEFAKMLVERGADVNIRDPKNTMTPLHLAVINDDDIIDNDIYNLIELIINNGADVNAKLTRNPRITINTDAVKSGDTPLSLVALLGDDKIYETLRSAGAKENIPIPNRNKKTPLGLFKLKHPGAYNKSRFVKISEALNETTENGVDATTILDLGQYMGINDIDKKKGGFRTRRIKSVKNKTRSHKKNKRENTNKRI